MIGEVNVIASSVFQVGKSSGLARCVATEFLIGVFEGTRAGEHGTDVVIVYSSSDKSLSACVPFRLMLYSGWVESQYSKLSAARCILRSQ